jgi:hypothetical protein
MALSPMCKFKPLKQGMFQRGFYEKKGTLKIFFFFFSFCEQILKMWVQMKIASFPRLSLSLSL